MDHNLQRKQTAKQLQVKAQRLSEHKFNYLEQDESVKQRFIPYQDLADNLTQQFTYQTKHDIVSAILTNDGS